MGEIAKTINRLAEEYRFVLAGANGLPHQVRSLLGITGSYFGADAGALAMWQTGAQLAVCSTWAFTQAQAKRMRRVFGAPPVCPGEPLARIGARLLAPQEPVDSGWLALDQYVSTLNQRNYLGVLPLPWAQGSGACFLVFKQQPQWDEEEARAGANVLILSLSSAFNRSLAVRHSDDYRRIFQYSRDMIYISSRDGRWVDVNEAGVKMLGYDSVEEVLAEPDLGKAAYFKPQDRAAFMEAIERDGYVLDYEVAFKRKDGTPIDVAITSQVREIDGKVVGYEGIIKDITRRKRAEVRAAQQQRMLESILEVMPVAVFVLDRDHTVRYWNRACEELTGWNKSDILETDRVWEVFHRPRGVSLADVILDGDNERLQKFYSKERLRPSPLAEDAWEAEAHFGNLGGKARELFFTAAPLKDSGGQIIGAVEAIVDSSQIKKLERRLAESEALYRTLVESNREGICLQDDQRIIFANSSFMEMFGLSDVGGVRGGILELLDPGCKKEYLQWMRAVWSEDGCDRVFEGQGLRDGLPFDLEITVGATEHGSRPAWLFNVRDVTFRKAIEEQLIRSERLAATGKLAFDVAHEVNNPLGGILTYAHLMAEDMGEASELYPMVEKIIKLTNRCRIIVRGLLDFARRDEPQKEAMDINRVLKETLSLMEGHMILRNVQVVEDFDQGLPYFYGHRSKLEQVFLNMLVNAAEAMEGRGRLDIRTMAHNGGAIEIQFADSGPGMDEEAVGRVFEPFYTTKGRGRGTGLGLSISHGIIKQHGGTIAVESVKGLGTTFRIVLPSQGDEVITERCFT
ncbi:PAS domain-containing sensor histidine kinase [Desulfarculus baarsii]